MQARQNEHQFQVREQLITTFTCLTSGNLSIAAQHLNDRTVYLNAELFYYYLQAQIKALVLENQDLNRNLQVTQGHLDSVQAVIVSTLEAKDREIQNLQFSLSLFRQQPVAAIVLIPAPASTDEQTSTPQLRN